jgi:hypothetical protein
MLYLFVFLSPHLAPLARIAPVLAPDGYLLCRSPATDKINPLECALMSKYRVLPGFGRSCPPITPLESALAKKPPATPLESAVTKRVGEGGPHARGLLPTIFRIFFQVPYRLSPLFATSESYRGVYPFFPFWNLPPRCGLGASGSPLRSRLPSHKSAVASHFEYHHE